MKAASPKLAVPDLVDRMFCIIVSIVDSVRGGSEMIVETRTKAHLSGLSGSSELGLSGSLVGSPLLEEGLRDGDLLKVIS